MNKRSIEFLVRNILSLVFAILLLTFNAPNVLAKSPIKINSSIETKFQNNKKSQYLLLTLNKNNISDSKSIIKKFQAISSDLGFQIHSELFNLDSVIAKVDYNQFQTLKNMRDLASIKEYKEFKLNYDNATQVTSNAIFDPNVIPDYHQAIGITNYNSTFRMSGSRQTIAFIDTGTNFEYKELSGKMVAEACFSNIIGDINGQSSSLCPNGQSTQIGAGASMPCSDLPGCQHGSIVAGIAIGRKTLTNHAGIAPNAKAISVNIFHSTTDPEICGTSVKKCLISSNFAYLKALDYLMSLQATVPFVAVNMSLGSASTYPDNCDDTDTETFHNLILRGVAIVVSAGNGGVKNQMSDPACQSKVISVASYNQNTQAISSFSNISPKTTYLAPGNSIRALGYFSSGTSMSAPMVTGAFALMAEAGSNSVLNSQEVLTNTGTTIPSYNAKLININKALSVIRTRGY